MSKTITICDIAKEAGVSISTVSRVLTGNAKVNSEKQERIQHIIDKYNFHPNMLARGLIQTRTKQIGYITADIGNPYYSTMFVNCEKAANALGYTLLLGDSFSEKEKELDLLEKMISQRVDAVIFVGGSVDAIKPDKDFIDRINSITKQIPVIITGHLKDTECKSVNIDSKKAMQLVMEHLHSCGYKRIAFAGGRMSVRFTANLRNEFYKLLKQYKLPYIEEFDVTNDNYDEQGGFDAMSQILEQKKKPDAVIAINDFTAVGVMRAITSHNLKIPQDISIISFDNTFLTTISNPKLTSVGYNYQQFGDIILKNVIDAINGKEVLSETLIEPQLIIRDSCRKIS